MICLTGKPSLRCRRTSVWRTTAWKSSWRARIKMSPPVRIFHGLDALPPDFGPSALTIGNFDGVHGGHGRILRRVRELADEGNWKASVLTFDPHPAKIVAPLRAPRLMTLPEQRCALMREMGIEQVLILP